MQPSGAHIGLARLQAAGWVPHVLTQNVDRLHQKAGAQGIVEIHGTTHECASPLMDVRMPTWRTRWSIAQAVHEAPSMPRVARAELQLRRWSASMFAGSFAQSAAS